MPKSGTRSWSRSSAAGGGAGFVYIGGMQAATGGRPGTRLHDGLRRSASILGSLVSRELPVPIEGVRRPGRKTVSYRAILGPRTAAPPPRPGRPCSRLRFRPVPPTPMLSREGRPTNAHVGLGDSVRHRGRRACAGSRIRRCRRGSAVRQLAATADAIGAVFARSASARSSVPGCGKVAAFIELTGSSSPIVIGDGRRGPRLRRGRCRIVSRRPFPVCCTMKTTDPRMIPLLDDLFEEEGIAAPRRRRYGQQRADRAGVESARPRRQARHP